MQDRLRSVVFCWLRNKISGKFLLTHSWGSGYKCTGCFRSHLCKAQFLFCHLAHCLTCVLSSFNFESVHITCLLCSHFLLCLMAKGSSHTKSRAVNLLTPASNCPRPTANFPVLFGIFQSERKHKNKPYAQ